MVAALKAVQEQLKEQSRLQTSILLQLSALKQGSILSLTDIQALKAPHMGNRWSLLLSALLLHWQMGKLSLPPISTYSMQELASFSCTLAKALV